MNPTSLLVLGGSVPASCNTVPSLLIRLPGEPVPTSGTFICPESLDSCLIYLRNHYADHQRIASLGGLQILADHPIEGTGSTAPSLSHEITPASIRDEWAPAIEAKLCELLDDLGNCPLDSWKGARHVILNGDRLALAPTGRELASAHAGHPAIVLGSGPSASDYLPIIARIRSGVRIFSADTMLHGLLQVGIVPDYVCAIEREPNITRVLAKDADCGAVLIASPFIEPECAQNWGDNLLFWHGADDIFRWIDPKIEAIPSGRSSGSLALAAAIHAGCSPIYLVGHDLSYRNGLSHADTAHPIAHSANKKALDEAAPTDPMRQRSQVLGNHTGMVETCGLWNRIRGDLEGIIANHPETKVWNVCGYGGARIAGAPVGDLPEMPLALPPIQRLPPSGVDSPLQRLPTIRIALACADLRLRSAKMRLITGVPLDEISNDLQVSRLFGEGNASLFHYVTRSVYNALTLRMHLDASNGANQYTSHRNALQILITTLLALIERMQKELTE